MSVAAIVLAAGRGCRAASCHGEAPKQFRVLAGRPLIGHTLAPFLAHPAIERIVVVVQTDQRPLLVEALGDDINRVMVVDGGVTRQESVAAGLAAHADEPPHDLLIHDAARPFVTRDLIDRVIFALADHEAVLPALSITDAVKRGRDGVVVSSLDRNGLFAAQTPQAFRHDLICDAHRRAALAEQTDFPDDASLIEWLGKTVHIVQGDADNIKLTTMRDIEKAERIFLMEQMLRLADRHIWADTRVGHGFDAHAFAPGPGDHVMLCGVAIPHTHALTGHSDADVGLHALTDAILGALCDGDIGLHFPPGDPAWKGMASERFLSEAVSFVTRRGGDVVHLDVTLICEAPKLSAHRAVMRERIAMIAGIAVSHVSVKATTTEQMGFTGRREGIAAMATATIRLPVDAADRVGRI